MYSSLTKTEPTFQSEKKTTQDYMNSYIIKQLT